MKHLIPLLLMCCFYSYGNSQVIKSIKTIQSSTPAEEVTNIAYFYPVSLIKYAEKGNKAYQNDSLSNITSSKLDSLLRENQAALHLSAPVVIENDKDKKRITSDLEYLATIIDKRKNVLQAVIPSRIRTYLKKNDFRFGMVVIAEGSERKPGNFGKQMAKGVAVGVLTGGRLVPVPAKHEIIISAFIFDVEKDEIAYFRKPRGIAKDPTNEKNLERQLMKVFEGYFYD